MFEQPEMLMPPAFVERTETTDAMTIDQIDARLQERLDRAADLGRPLHLRPKEVVQVRELGREVLEKRAVFHGLLTAFSEGTHPEDCMLRAEAFMRSLSSASGVARAIAALDLATGRKGS